MKGNRILPTYSNTQGCRNEDLVDLSCNILADCSRALLLKVYCIYTTTAAVKQTMMTEAHARPQRMRFKTHCILITQVFILLVSAANEKRA